MNRVSIPDAPDQADSVPRGFAGYRLLETLGREADEEWRDTVKRYMDMALPKFPELAGRTISVGRMDPTDDDYHARADRWNELVFFRVEEIPPMDTVFHELAHLAIYKRKRDGEDVPHTSEPFCSITSTARIPPEWIQRGDIAYLGEPSIPKTEWPGVCERALEYRHRHRQYIAKCKEWLAIEREQDRNTGKVKGDISPHPRSRNPWGTQRESPPGDVGRLADISGR